MEDQSIRVHTPYITARMMWAVDATPNKRRVRWRAVGSNNYELTLQCDDATRDVLQAQLDALGDFARKLEHERMQRKFPHAVESQSTGTDPDADGHVLPWVNQIDSWLSKGMMGDHVMRDRDVAGGDAHYFWTAHCDDRPGIQLFVCASWHASDTDPQVLVTMDVRFIDDQEPIVHLGAVTLVSIAPRIVGRIVLDAVDTFHKHGHI